MNQKDVLNILKAGRNVYLTGAAGSGKTHVLNEYIEYLKNRNVCVGVTASTGIAATHLKGVTIHSWSGIGIKSSLRDNDVEELLQKEHLWKRYDKTKVLIIDEVSMLHAETFDSINRLAKKMKQSDEPFGGMQVVLSGDFFQLPPIVKGDRELRYVDSSDAWREMDIRVCYLSTQYRHDGNDLESILSEMRGGDISTNTRELFEEMVGMKKKMKVTPTRLHTHNIDVDKVNEKELDKLDGHEKIYEMNSHGRKNLSDNLKKSVLAPEILKLKVGSVVMFVKNNFEEGYVNGTLGIVENLNDGMPTVKTLNGKKIDATYTKWEIEDDGKVLASVEQIPLRLAWAITVHKSQGMSMDAAEIDLSRSFVPGQGYVALSRLKTLEGLTLLGINSTAFSVDPYVLELDKRLKSESNKWEKVISKFENDDFEKMHEDFILKCGGTIDKKEIEENKKKEKIGIEKKIPSHVITRDFLMEGLSLKDIAKKREMTLGTIISHLEKIKDLDSDFDLKLVKPEKINLTEILTAFEETKGTKLAPVHRKLKGKYTYEELRLSRLFL